MKSESMIERIAQTIANYEEPCHWTRDVNYVRKAKNNTLHGIRKRLNEAEDISAESESIITDYVPARDRKTVRELVQQVLID